MCLLTFIVFCFLVKIHQQGYAVLEDFLRPEEVDELKTSGEEFTNNLPSENNRKIFNTVEHQQVKHQSGTNALK